MFVIVIPQYCFPHLTHNLCFSMTEAQVVYGFDQEFLLAFAVGTAAVVAWCYCSGLVFVIVIPQYCFPHLTHNPCFSMTQVVYGFDQEFLLAFAVGTAAVVAWCYCSALVFVIVIPQYCFPHLTHNPCFSMTQVVYGFDQEFLLAFAVGTAAVVAWCYCSALVFVIVIPQYCFPHLTHNLCFSMTEAQVVYGFDQEFLLAFAVGTAAVVAWCYCSALVFVIVIPQYCFPHLTHNLCFSMTEAQVVYGFDQEFLLAFAVGSAAVVAWCYCSALVFVIVIPQYCFPHLTHNLCFSMTEAQVVYGFDQEFLLAFAVGTAAVVAWCYCSALVFVIVIPQYCFPHLTHNLCFSMTEAQVVYGFDQEFLLAFAVGSAAVVAWCYCSALVFVIVIPQYCFPHLTHNLCFSMTEAQVVYGFDQEFLLAFAVGTAAVVAWCYCSALVFVIVIPQYCFPHLTHNLCFSMTEAQVVYGFDQEFLLAFAVGSAAVVAWCYCSGLVFVIQKFVLVVDVYTVAVVAVVTYDLWIVHKDVVTVLLDSGFLALAENLYFDNEFWLVLAVGSAAPRF